MKPVVNRSPKLGIRTKALIAMISLGLIALLIAAAVSFFLGRSGMQEMAQTKLKSLGAAKADAVEACFQNLQQQVLSLADTDNARSALIDLSSGREELEQDLKSAGFPVTTSSIEPINGQLKQYYGNNLVTLLNKARNRQLETAESFMHESLQAKILQYAYIVNNSRRLGLKHEMGSKEQVMALSTDKKFGAAFARTKYAEAHGAAHSFFSSIKTHLNCYDVFLVNPEGFVVYTAAKNLDFAGSLKIGPEKQSALGQLFQKVLAMDQKTEGVWDITDFTAYPKAFDTPLCFVGSPVFNRSGNKMGVLVIAITPDRLTSIVTSNNRQEALGLGQTGQVYILGKDGVMRTEARFLSLLQDGQKRRFIMPDGVTQPTTAVLANKVESAGVSLALERKEGSRSYTDSRGKEVVGYWKPIEVKGLQFVLMAEMESKEAFGALWRQIRGLAFASLPILGLIGWLAWLMSSKLTKPIGALAQAADEISRGNNNVRAVVNTGDEIGRLANSFNQMLTARLKGQQNLEKENKDLQQQIRDLLEVVSEASDGRLDVRAKVTAGVMGNISDALNLMLENFGELIGQAKLASDQVARSAAQITQASEQLEKSSAHETDEIRRANSGVLELNDQAKTVLHNCEIGTRAAGNTREAAEQGVRAVSAVISAMERIRESVQANSKKIKRLGDRSMEISGIVKVIADLSAKTDMLALNASIEAARAGEQGRGFTVVAEQVRGLSDRTRALTTQIERLVGDITRETAEAVLQMETQTQEVENGARTAHSAGGALGKISEATDQASKLVSQINQVATRQAEQAGHVLGAMENMQRSVAETESRVQFTSRTSDQLLKLAGDLDRRLNQFQVHGGEADQAPTAGI